MESLIERRRQPTRTGLYHAVGDKLSSRSEAAAAAHGGSGSSARVKGIE